MRHQNGRKNSRRDPSGIILADVVLGLLIVSATGALLSMTIAQHHKATERLAASRGALRAAERALNDLQMGQVPSASDENLEWKVRPLEGIAPSGRAWVEVRAAYQKRSAAVTGLVPVAAPSTQGSAP